jgi:hypothetical protein
MQKYNQARTPRWQEQGANPVTNEGDRSVSIELYWNPTGIGYQSYSRADHVTMILTPIIHTHYKDGFIVRDENCYEALPCSVH